MRSGRKRRRVERLWRDDPRCRCCGCITVLPGPLLKTRNDGTVHLPHPVPQNLATLQHHDGRLSTVRGTGRDEERTTLYCWACNQRENDIAQEGASRVALRARARLGHLRRRTA